MLEGLTVGEKTKLLYYGLWFAHPILQLGIAALMLRSTRVVILLQPEVYGMAAHNGASTPDSDEYYQTPNDISNAADTGRLKLPAGVAENQ